MRHTDIRATGGGLYGVDKVIRIKEQADHGLPYLLAVFDGDVMPAQFTPDCIIKPDVQGLLKKILGRPNHEYTDEYSGQACIPEMSKSVLETS